MICLSQDHALAIQAFSQTSYPYECCGGMLGTVEGDVKTIQRLVSLVNVSEEDQRRRFKVTKDDYQRLEREASESEMTLLGFYHSHPDHPAVPSETDLKFAWPFFSYIIQSVYKKEPRDCRSYVLSDAGAFVEEEVQIV